MRQSLLRTAILVTAALVGQGCGGDGRKPLYPASGRVVDAAGNPVAGATLVFHPLASPEENAHKPAATTNASGAFTLTTYKENDGAPAGEYVITIEHRPPPKRALDPEQPDKLGGKFRDPKSSPFKATIERKTNELTFQLP